jgi:hypothetical protein
MFHAHCVDLIGGVVPESWLVQLDRIVAIHVNSSTQGMGDHWAEYKQPSVWQNSFLSLAIQYNLCTYLEKKLSTDTALINAKAGRPLLEYVVNSIPVKEDLCSIRLISILLQYGADPNEVYRG